jgi:L-fucose mutarotase
MATKSYWPMATFPPRATRSDSFAATATVFPSCSTLFSACSLYVSKPAALMQVTPGDKTKTPIWGQYADVVRTRTGLADSMEQVERFAFYERAKRAYAVIATGESALYANLILKKGVIAPEA